MKDIMQGKCFIKDIFKLGIELFKIIEKLQSGWNYVSCCEDLYMYQSNPHQIKRMTPKGMTKMS